MTQRVAVPQYAQFRALVDEDSNLAVQFVVNFRTRINGGLIPILVE